MRGIKDVRAKNVCKSYEDFAVKSISFTLPRGYIMGFVGPNGAGKSTTIKMIMNLIRKDSGEIKIFGKDNKKAEKEIKQNIGFVYDENHYYEDLTCEQMKRIIAPLYKSGMKSSINRICIDCKFRSIKN